MSHPRWPRRLLRTAAQFALGVIILVNIAAAKLAYISTHVLPADRPTFAQYATTPLAQAWGMLGGTTTARPMSSATPDAVGLAYEARSIPMDAGEQLEAWYVPQAQPRGVAIMFTGYMAAKDSLLRPAQELHQLGYSCLLVDVRGAGGSSGELVTLGMREADDVAAAFGYAAQQWPGQPLVGYGISMGATALMRATAQGQIAPAALILEGPFDSMLNTIGHRIERIAPRWPTSELVLLWGSLEIGQNGFAHNPSTYARAITCPVLLMRGERDPWVRAEDLAAIAAALPSPPQVLTAPGQGHTMPFAVGAPDLWVPAVRSFLGGLG